VAWQLQYEYFEPQDWPRKLHISSVTCNVILILMRISLSIRTRILIVLEVYNNIGRSTFSLSNIIFDAHKLVVVLGIASPALISECRRSRYMKIQGNL
jgi:hypothetical protein